MTGKLYMLIRNGMIPASLPLNRKNGVNHARKCLYNRSSHYVALDNSSDHVKHESGLTSTNLN